jgi:delta14-sterol reductase
VASAYTGDWIMSLAWCADLRHWLHRPLLLYNNAGILLSHRDQRDDHACSIKYGPDWAGKVPYRLIPYVYPAAFVCAAECDSLC